MEGRSTEKELLTLRRHLTECARCRAAVAARAGGVRGPGDTVLLKPTKRGLPVGFKVGAVAMSLAVVVGAWRFTKAPAASPSPVASVAAVSPVEASEAGVEQAAMPREPRVAPLALEASTAEVSAVEAPASTLGASTTEASASEASTAEASTEASALEAPRGGPTVRFISAAPESLDDAAGEGASAVAREPRSGGSRRGRARRAREERSVSSRDAPPPPAAEEFDFGIDELEPSPPTLKGRPIRTSLD